MIHSTSNFALRQNHLGILNGLTGSIEGIAVGDISDFHGLLGPVVCDRSVACDVILAQIESGAGHSPHRAHSRGRSGNHRRGLATGGGPGQHVLHPAVDGGRSGTLGVAVAIELAPAGAVDNTKRPAGGNSVLVHGENVRDVGNLGFSGFHLGSISGDTLVAHKVGNSHGHLSPGRRTVELDAGQGADVGIDAMATQNFGFTVPPVLLRNGVGLIGVPRTIEHNTPFGHSQRSRRAELALAGVGIVIRPSHDTVLIRNEDAVKSPVRRGHVGERGAAVCCANDLQRSLRDRSGGSQGGSGQGQGECQGKAQADFLMCTHFN